MSGVESAPEAHLMEMAAQARGRAAVAGGAALMLAAELGEETFRKAHARLHTVVEEEDDDVLVRDIQKILGHERLDKLPLILKLIFLEGGGGAA